MTGLRVSQLLIYGSVLVGVMMTSYFINLTVKNTIMETQNIINSGLVELTWFH